MRPIAWTFPLMLALSLVARAEDAEKSWDLKIGFKPVVGAKCDSVKTSALKTKMKMVQGEAVLKEDTNNEVGSYEYSCETTAVDNDKQTGAKWTFRKAARSKGAESVSCGFEGKTVSGTRGDGGEWAFTYEDGSAIAEEDLSSLKDAVGKKKKAGEEKPDIDSLFQPQKPVKVGESWSPDLAAISKSFGGEKMKVDIEDSKANCTLKSIEVRDGATWGNIVVEIDMSVVEIPPVAFDEPFHFNIQIVMEVCIDGTRPDGRVTATMKLDGKRKATVTQGTRKVTFDMSLGMDGQMSETRSSGK